MAQEAGHHVVDKAIVKENRYAIRAQVSAWIASDDVQVVLITGGTGLTERRSRDSEALLPLFDREVEGFGEVFRMLSFEEIGTSTLQSRAVAGVANNAYFRHAGFDQSVPYRMGNIIAPQLDARTRP
ncbi:molybdopterin-binding protein [Escherichia coli]